MANTTRRGDAPYRAATGLVAFLGLYQGAVPLVARGLFDADQRLAPALWLPTPWWWITCLAIAAVTLALLAAVDGARQRRFPDDAPSEGDGEPAEPADTTEAAAANPSGGYDALAGLVFLIGLYNGVAPFIARLVFDSGLLLAFPLRLDAPWWWVTSLSVIAVAAVLLALIDHAKQRPRPPAPVDE